MAETKNAATGVAELAADARPQADEAPEASAEQPQEESQSSDEGGTNPLADFLQELSPEEFDRILQQRPELAESSAYIKERERRAEQRGRTVAQEAQRTASARQEAYDAALAAAEQAAAALDQGVEALAQVMRRLEKASSDWDTDAIEEAQKELKKVAPEGLAEAIRVYAYGNYVQGVRQAMADLRESLAKHTKLFEDIPLSDEEVETLTKAQTEDARAGTQKAPIILMDLLIDRARKAGFEEGRKAGRKEAESDVKLLEKASQLTKAIRSTPPRVQGAVRSPSERERLLQEMRSIDVTTPEGLAKWRERESEFHEALVSE